MNTELISITNSIKELNIYVSKDEFDAIYYQELNSIRQKIKMPGFRPGRVPLKLIESQYGKSIKLEAGESIANEEFKKFLDKNTDVQIIGTPVFKEIKENEDGSQVYTIKIEVIPDFELKDYKSLEIFEPYHKVTDEEIEKEVNFKALELGEMTEIDVVTNAAECSITVDVYLLDNNTKQPVDAPPEEMVMDLDDIYKDDEYIEFLRKEFLNKKVSDYVDWIAETEKYPNEISERLVIKKIEKRIPCEINDDFAKLASKERFDNLEDYKQDIGFSLQRFWDDRTRQLMEEQVISKVTELHDDIEVPDVLIMQIKEQMIKSHKERYPEYNPDEEKSKEYLDVIAPKIARVQLVQDKIVKKEKMEVEDYDYENFVDDFFAKNVEFSNYMTKDVMLQHVKADENTKQSLLKKKYVDFLLDFTKTNEIDYDEYINKNLNNQPYNNEVKLMDALDDEMLDDEMLDDEMFDDYDIIDDDNDDWEVIDDNTPIEDK
ncbi:MAG: hypothetical protein FWG85_01800 [Bacteroidetes bacterium]|nr:hypothetical protein [Bacteroidota bacterium]